MFHYNHSVLHTTPIKAFMDDLVLISSLKASTQQLLDLCVTALKQAGMLFRASKSRSLVMKKGKVLDQSPFAVSSEPIPLIHSNPIKF